MVAALWVWAPVVVTFSRLTVAPASVVRLARAVVPPTAALKCVVPFPAMVSAWAPSTVPLKVAVLAFTVVAPASVAAPLAEKAPPLA